MEACEYILMAKQRTVMTQQSQVIAQQDAMMTQVNCDDDSKDTMIA